MKTHKIHLLDAYLEVTAGGAMAYTNRNPERGWMEIPVTAAVVEHKDGKILLDTDIALDAMETNAGDLIEAFPIKRISEDNRIERQLGNIGMKPGYIMVISHLHLDHAGQVKPFMEEKIPVIVQKRSRNKLFPCYGREKVTIRSLGSNANNVIWQIS
ncbi:metal dependent hydrolase, beta-Lactamase superfamily [Picrophilus oshimae DSM 9789]|uniref:Metal dependent hydrolase, beta-Lactamase superfamily n=1 Tax=Picrophilus torridus (strain ATCC 700027 / DSM 9790 / JCM 10055 / NBRC 100828 / KAW 2/3) TaxID=1122961 RepID=Q6L073_PICTO|nr:metal dependent hydrolase, beta-Lactamase superfamily [Picrophilus oshimae DSM 9789]